MGAATAALVGVSSGCGAVPATSSAAGAATTAAAPSSAAGTCHDYHFPFPKAAASASGADSGRSFAVPVGGLVEVALVGSASQRWEPIQLSGDNLVALPNPAQAATVGTRLAEYCAATSGTATLTSSQGGASWSITVTVR